MINNQPQYEKEVLAILGSKVMDQKTQQTGSLIKLLEKLDSGDRLACMTFILKNHDGPEIAASHEACMVTKISEESYRENAEKLKPIIKGVEGMTFDKKMTVEELSSDVLALLDIMKTAEEKQVALAMLLMGRLTPFNFKKVDGVPSDYSMHMARVSHSDEITNALNTVNERGFRYYDYHSQALDLLNIVKNSPDEVGVLVLSTMLKSCDKASSMEGEMAKMAIISQLGQMLGRVQE